MVLGGSRILPTFHDWAGDFTPTVTVRCVVGGCPTAVAGRCTHLPTLGDGGRARRCVKEDPEPKPTLPGTAGPGTRRHHGTAGDED